MHITLNDVIHQTLTDRVIDGLSNINRGEEITLDIDSPGGSVRHGYKLVKALRKASANGSKITANITGTAASMASIIAMAADKVRIEKSAVFMIHDASISLGGNPAELRELASIVDELSNDLADIYSARSKKPVGEVRNMMKATTYFTAEEAVKHGFADEVFEASAQLPETLLERIAALEKEVSNAKTSTLPPASAARRLEIAARKTAQALTKDRAATKYFGTTATEILALPEDEQRKLPAATLITAARFGTTAEAAKINQLLKSN
ncbi:head maturation protease, ClpP-related [Haloferula chungangensis]|uniref:ATP-dependent Clp protease proteolytic subunit n=1 Tax=Haloferula chungangensis TaxID=1048331 RepID=A0ABW2L087_9BACT